MENFKEWLKANEITEVECIVPDMSGVSRGKIMPADKFANEGGMRLPESIFTQTVTGSYAERAYDIANPTDIDMSMRPDPDTVRPVPWAKEPTAQVIHDSYYLDGSAVELAPRHVLRKIINLYNEEGWQPIIAPELEFYLVKPNLDPDYPLEPPAGRSGRPEIGSQAYSIDAVNEFDLLFEDVYNYCEAQGIEIDNLIHEMGAAQMEINLLHGDPLVLADQAFLFKRTMREAAFKNSVYATFMAKPMEDQPGSAMHIHQSVIDVKTKKNIFSDEQGNANAAFYAHIAGLQKYLPAAMSFLSPYVNSYRRIVRYGAAPINLQWGYDNRTVGLRVPHSEAQARRVENRVASADANPYIAIAASLACGYLGMKEMLKPTDPLESSAYELPIELPHDLFEALGLLNESEPLQNVLGSKFTKVYTAIKETEFETFMRVISPWEREYLLLNV
ncbi:MAG: glutamine synthetase family protein [Arenicellales bacterium]|nr:glutamine synthetase family protein [Arenicellales bacterium]